MKLLAIASGGGHWVELIRLRPSFEGHETIYVTVSEAYREDVGEAKFYTVRDATRWNKLGLLVLAAQITWIMLRERPDAVVSTGAAPGYFAIRLARLVGARTVWLDSIANVNRLSMSGERAGRSCDLWLTQWPHLARTGGPEFRGQIL